ncbi:tyrosine-type recombinase/integrase [Nocardia cyriacigeorgica]|uniref:tyrosine-type recombinase/integrase n=1 Tax=Nocardia cyriacigeorgica TaxID=135487 RepID=UPI001486B1C0|nr:site-specific integrase [Nocardia cyriacigeorgica]
MTTTSLTVVAPTKPEPGAVTGIWVDRVREAVASILVNDRIAMSPEDPVGGGPPCTAPGCPRSVRHAGLCSAHYERWHAAGRPDQSQWDPGTPLGIEYLSLAALPTPLRWEIAYGILRARQERNVVHLRLSSVHTCVEDLAAIGMSSLLDYEEDQWPSRGNRYRGQTQRPTIKLRIGFLTFIIDEIDRLRGLDGREHEFSRDAWRGRRIGFNDAAHGWLLDFRPIPQPWLRQAVKNFIRWRIDIGHSASGIHRDMLVLKMMSSALTDHAGPDARPEQFDRTVITRLLTLFAEARFTPNGINQRLSSAKVFFVIARQHDWIPGVPARTAIYSEDFPDRGTLAPRGLSAVVMAQLENPANLDKLADRRWRLLIPLLMETGLRANDALHLPLDCLVRDQQNAPYLRYYNRKMKREALVPISTETAAAITTQIEWVRSHYSPNALLFPRERQNPDGTRPIRSTTLRAVMNQWMAECGIVDDAGAPAQVTAHQFRHTLGTTLINNDVPQEIVRKILDHTSPEMTAHYARLHDNTVRRHWERARKVDIHGNDVILTADSPLADAEWTKQHLSRATQALPNGYCGLPLQQSCPHANACLTCPVFITTPEFLPQHRQQLDLTRGIIERAQQRGQLRLAEMNQQTADNLLQIITSLEQPTEPGDDAR